MCVLKNGIYDRKSIQGESTSCYSVFVVDECQLMEIYTMKAVYVDHSTYGSGSMV